LRFEGDVRTLDALHLAAAQRVGGPAMPFLTFDLRQAQAARSLGLTVVGA
jgi:predicted nucleic acid-binding protein